MATLRAAPTRHHHTKTLQWNTYRSTTYLAHPQEGGRDGKNQAQNGSEQQANATTLCEELRASNYVYKSRRAPAKGIGPPLVQLGKNG